jgi:peptidoglycan/xylan/chitin deacetylase (PgdA/CDA1 family)
MRVPGFVGKAAMALACRVYSYQHVGVIINEHTLTRDETRAHVDALGRWFDFIHHDELLDRLKRPKARPFCLLTFDDGKLSNATVTAPELERLGVPAAFYVTTGFLDGTMLWFDRQEAISRSLGFTPPGLEQETLKELPIDLIDERLNSAFEKYNIALDTQSDEIRPMSWDEARDLSRRGFSICSHNLRHTLLTRETEALAFSQMKQSIERISYEIGTRCVSFAFPNGNYTEALACHALACGVDTVMTTEPTWVTNLVPRWRLPRVQLSSTDTRARIELKLAVAATGRLLANPDGTGRLYRKINRTNSALKQ